MTAPRFSVVVPAYNAARTVGPAVRSALLQSISDLEVLVVDDGSADETVAVVRRLAESDARVRLFEQEHLGPSAARNLALGEARGELVSFLDADDILLPRYLERMGAALEAAPRAGWAYTDAWVLDDRTGRIRRASAMAYQRPPSHPPADPAEMLRLLLRRNFVFISTTVRREVVDVVGPWHATASPVEDYEYWLRILAHGFAAVRVAGRQAVYRRWSGSNSSDAGRLLASLLRVCHEVESDWGLDPRTRAAATRRRRHVERLVRRYESSGRVDGLTRLAVAVWGRTKARPGWLAEPPPDVAAALEAAGEAPR